jgi:hypothetical protein
MLADLPVTRDAAPVRQPESGRKAQPERAGQGPAIQGCTGAWGSFARAGSQASKLLNKTQNACPCVNSRHGRRLAYGVLPPPDARYPPLTPVWPCQPKQPGPTTRRNAQSVAPRATAAAGTTTGTGHRLFFSIVSKA